MSSREIAELTGKRHPDVKRDIHSMASELQEDVSSFSRIYLDSMNRQQTEYLLDREHTDCLLTGYSAAMRMAVIKRWRELESGRSVGALPDFSNPATAARAWAEQFERSQQLAIERDQAVMTKAEIGSRREATAMNTASQAVKKVAALQVQLDTSAEYCTIKRMEMLRHGQKFDWRRLKQTGVEMGVEAIDVFDQNYGTVKAYHESVWLEAYGLRIEA